MLSTKSSLISGIPAQERIPPAAATMPVMMKAGSAPMEAPKTPPPKAAIKLMKYLEERGIGFDVGVTKVPLVCQADLFDLTVGDPSVRPDKEM